MESAGACGSLPFLLADEMGLGKCLTSMTVAAVDFERGQAERSCSSSCLLARQLVGGDRLHTHYSAVVAVGSPTYRLRCTRGSRTSGHDILVVGYETLVNDNDGSSKIIWDVADRGRGPLHQVP